MVRSLVLQVHDLCVWRAISQCDGCRQQLFERDLIIIRCCTDHNSKNTSVLGGRSGTMVPMADTSIPSLRSFVSLS